MSLGLCPCYGAAALAVVILLSGCGKSETKAKQELIPDICLGVFTGQTPAYSMRDESGQLIQINGNTIDVPAIDNTVVVTKVAAKLTQVAGGKTVRGDGKVRLIHANPKEVLIETEVFDQSNSHPTYQIRYDVVSGTATMSQIGLKAKTPDTPLQRMRSK
ncbi:MAG: hypothetical protein FJ395_01895 [Verrucomicrobia bacterium]|nr:hypothetical protein [Verrucomicrobiota bacterium]